MKDKENEPDRNVQVAYIHTDNIESESTTQAMLAVRCGDLLAIL